MMEHWREKRNQKIEKKLEDQRKQAEDQARKSIADYTSTRSILRKSLPMILLGLVLAGVEYIIIGAIYTIVSLLIYMPMLYFYTKSVRPVRGKYLGEVSHSGGHMKINRYLVPDELFELIDFGKPIAPRKKLPVQEERNGYILKRINLAAWTCGSSHLIIKQCSQRRRSFTLILNFSYNLLLVHEIEVILEFR